MFIIYCLVAGRTHAKPYANGGIVATPKDADKFPTRKEAQVKASQLALRSLGTTFEVRLYKSMPHEKKESEKAAKLKALEKRRADCAKHMTPEQLKAYFRD